jgi:hypothetical protein
MRHIVIALTLLATTPALADAPTIKDTYGFDIMKPKSSKCAKVTGALLKKLTKSYTCETSEEGTGASGKTPVADCKAKKGSSEFLLMKTAAECKVERQTQIDNGDGA